MIKYITYLDIRKSHISHLYAECVEDTKAKAKAAGISYEVFEGQSGDIADVSYEADLFRFQFLKDNPDYAYLDADVIVNKWPDFKMIPDKVYIPVKGGFDFGIIINNGCNKITEAVMSYYNSSGENPKSMWIPKLIKNLKGYIEILDGVYFKHLLLSSLKKAPQGFSQCGSQDFSIKVIEGKYVLTW